MKQKVITNACGTITLTNALEKFYKEEGFIVCYDNELLCPIKSEGEEEEDGRYVFVDIKYGTANNICEGTIDLESTLHDFIEKDGDVIDFYETIDEVYESILGL